MTRAARLAQYALVLWVAITLNFALPRLAPGDPLETLTGDAVELLTEDERRRLAVELGLDGSLLAQYGRYLAGIARGDLGHSFRFAAPVTGILLDRLQWTLLLVLPALVISVVVGTALGALAAWRRQRANDIPLLVGMLAVDSVPVFWIGMILIAVFAGWLGWLPAFGVIAAVPAGGPLDAAADIGRRLLMPVATLAIGGIPDMFLVARASLLTTLGEDYVAFAEARGLSPRRVLFSHALRNAMLPIYTRIALSLGQVAGGAVLIETVFGYPGLGRLMTEAVAMRDFPLLQGGLLLLTIGVIAGNALADFLYPLFDPRVRSRR